jgi:hypothetical protein
VSENADHVLQATQVVQVGQTVSEPLHLGPQHFLNAAQTHFRPEVDSLGDRIRWASLREAEVIEGLKSIDRTAPKALTNGVAMWEEDNGFVYYKGHL